MCQSSLVSDTSRSVLVGALSQASVPGERDVEFGAQEWIVPEGEVTGIVNCLSVGSCRAVVHAVGYCTVQQDIVG